MKAPGSTSRRPTTNGLTTTAGAIVALMAIAATVTAAPTGRTAIIESRSSLTESSAMRAVAAAMAAVARELAGGERVDSAMPVASFIEPLLTPDSVAQLASANDFEHARSTQLDERLLDLPPPGC